MTNVAIALQSFWAGFDIPAYVENAVPDNAQMPYITYRLAQPDWRETMSMYARIWYRSTSFRGLAAKVDEISQAIGTGLTVPFTGGFITLFKDGNFAQYMPDEDETIKVAYLSLTMHAMEV